MMKATETQTVYTEVVIMPCPSGFGEYQCGELSVSPDCSYALLQDLENAGELTSIDDALTDPEFQAAGIQDIRGRIHNQPGRIYAKIKEDAGGKRVAYYGVEESEVPLDFYGKPSHNQQGEQAHQQIEAIFKANPMDYSNYTAQFSTEPSYYGQECSQREANEIVGRLQMMIGAEFPGIRTRIQRDSGDSATLGPSQSVCERIDKWIEENWTKAI